MVTVLSVLYVQEIKSCLKRSNLRISNNKTSTPGKRIQTEVERKVTIGNIESKVETSLSSVKVANNKSNEIENFMKQRELLYQESRERVKNTCKKYGHDRGKFRTTGFFGYELFHCGHHNASLLLIRTSAAGASEGAILH